MMTELLERFTDELQDGEFSIAELIVAMAVLIIGHFVALLSKRLVNRYFARIPGVPAVIVGDVATIVQWVVYLVAIGIALSVVGVDVAWFAIAAIVILIVAGLVLRPQVENLAAGLVLTARPAFTVGDVIEVDRKVGTVMEIGSHSTALMTVEAKRVSMPNKELLGQTVTVYSAKEARRTDFYLALEPHTDLDHATTVITDALTHAPIIVSDPAPEVVASKFDANAVGLTVWIWFPSTMISDAPALDAGIRATYAALEAAGLELDVVDISVIEQKPTNQPPEPPQDG